MTDERVLKSFWQTLMSMTGYSFCKPHSASYAQVSFEAAYLRAHYPAAFIAAVLSNGGGYYTVQAYVSEAMRLGLAVLGPDVNASAIKWRSEGMNAVRSGLMAVTGLSAMAMDIIVTEREGKPYAGLDEFLSRTRLHTDDLRRLVLVGALDSLAPDLNRPQLLWYVAQKESEPEKKSRKKQNETQSSGPAGSNSLFATAAHEIPTDPGYLELTPPHLPGYTLGQRRESEFSVLGYIPDCHPLLLFVDDIRRDAEHFRSRDNPLLTRMSRLDHHVGRMVVVIAWPITAKIVETKQGDAMMFQTFEDGEALCETVVFPQEFKKYHRLLGTVQPLWLTGKVLSEFGVTTLQLFHVEPLRTQEKGSAQLVLQR